MRITHRLSRRAKEHAPPRRRNSIYVDGLALRYVLILCDKAVADATYAACHLDTITLRFPEGEFTAILAQRSKGELLMTFNVAFHSPNEQNLWRTSWKLTVAGAPGAARHRTTIVREIVRARRYYAQVQEEAGGLPSVLEERSG